MQAANPKKDLLLFCTHFCIYDVIQGITREDVSGDIDRQSSMGFDARA